MGATTHLLALSTDIYPGLFFIFICHAVHVTYASLFLLLFLSVDWI